MSTNLTEKKIKSALSGERVSLVGGAGFIGHNLALGLRRFGAEVQVIDNLMQNNLITNVSDQNLDPFRRELTSPDISIYLCSWPHSCGTAFTTIGDLNSVTSMKPCGRNTVTTIPMSDWQRALQMPGILSFG